MEKLFTDIWNDADQILADAEEQNELNFFDPEQPSWEEAELQTDLAEILESIPAWEDL